jgi:Lon protease-like protein
MRKAPQKPEDCPDVVPVFPLSGALLLPRGQMPLNIFEPRYLAIVDAALKDARMIGMVQPDPDHDTGARVPELAKVGCLGKITQFSEIGDNRYMITLSGVSRFRIVEEVLAVTPYRQCRIDYAPFIADFTEKAGEDQVDRASLIKTLKDFVEANDLSIDWNGINSAGNEALVNALSMMAPFGAREKQALLEAEDLKTRADLLVAMTEIELARGDDGTDATLQ